MLHHLAGELSPDGASDAGGLSPVLSQTLGQICSGLRYTALQAHSNIAQLSVQKEGQTVSLAGPPTASRQRHS